MYVLPLVSRELNVALRRPWAVLLRKWVGGGTMAATVWALMAWDNSGGRMGVTLFHFFTLFAASACIFIGIFLTSDCLSREKREGTLGFLFLTDLYPADVVLGKLSAAGIVPASLLLAMFPGFAVCQLAGGVSAGEFWRTMAALILTLLFVLSATVFISSRSTTNRQSYGWAAALLLMLNPLWLCWSAFDSNYRSLRVWRSVPVFWLELSGFVFLTILFLVAACQIVDRNWRDKEKLFAPIEKKKKIRWFGRDILEKQPIAWLMLRRRDTARQLDLFAIIAVAFTFALLMPWTFNPTRKYLFLGLLFGLHLGYQLLVLARTAYSFYFDRQDGSLELLLGTRLKIEDVFGGFYSYLLQHSQRSLLVLSAIDIVACFSLLAAGDLVAASLPFAMGATLWSTVLALGWLGVYRSLMTNHPLHAMAATFLRLSFFPLLISSLFILSPRRQITEIVVFWIISTAFIGIFFAMESRRTLFKYGRELLMRPYNEKPPHIESELSFINWDDAIPKPPPLPVAEKRLQGV